MPATLRSLCKTLEEYFTTKDQVELPQHVLDITVEYAEQFTYSDPADSQRLHEELVNVHQHVSEPKYEAPFLEVLQHLVPCLTTLEQHQHWFGLYIHPALNSAGQLNTVVNAARDFLITVMVHDYDVEDENSLKVYREISRQYCLWILDIYLGESEWFTSNNKDTLDEERDRFTKMNSKLLLVQYGSKRGKAFMEILNERLVATKHRASSLVLMSVYASQQPRQLFEIQHTPLLESLYNCLEYDLSSTTLSIAANVLAMTLPHVCNKIVQQLPRILAIYGRLACWRMEPEEQMLDEAESKETPKEEPKVTSNGWQVLHHQFNIQDERRPSITPLFTFIYGLFPSNFLSFLRKPSKHFEKRGYNKNFDDFWDDYEILAMSKPIFELHMLHPSLVSNTAEEEIRDEGRFEQIGGATDIASYCLQLYNQVHFGNEKPQEPEYKLPFDEIPTLYDGDVPNYSYISGPADRANEEDENAEVEQRQVMSLNNNMGALIQQHEKLYSNSRQDTHANGSATKADNHAPSPCPANESAATIAPTTMSTTTHAPVSDEALARLRTRSGTMSSPGFLPLNSNKSPGSTPSSNTPQVPSPKVEYKSALSHSTLPDDCDFDDRVSALQGKINEQQNIILYYQRELMIQKNELDFVSFIEQHSQYRYRQMRNQLSRKIIADERLRQVLHERQDLRQQLAGMKRELETSQKNIATYKRERRQYEENIMSKSKEFRQIATDKTAECDRLSNELEELRKERDHINQTMVAQEVKISKLELKLKEAKEKSKYVDSYKQLVKEKEEELDGIKAHNVLCTEENSCQSDTQVSKIQGELDDVKLERDALQEELKQKDIKFNKQLEDARTRLMQLESRTQEPNEKFKNVYQEMKRRDEERLAQSKAALDELNRRYLALETDYHKLAAETESTRRHTTKKSLLGFDIEDEASSMHSEYSGGRELHSSHDTPLFGPQAQTSYGDLRIRGRGGVNALHSNNSGTSTPSRKASSKHPFRGVRM